MPIFDYAMAEGVKKTFRRLYTTNLAKAVSFTLGIEDYTEVLEEFKLIAGDIAKEYGLYPSLAEQRRIQGEGMGDRVRDSTATSSRTLQDRAAKARRIRGDRPRDLPGNGSAHSQPEHDEFPRRRADAVLLDKLRHRHLPGGQDGYQEHTARRRKHGLGNGETPIFPIHIFKVKEGVNYNPGDPNYDLFKLAMPRFTQSALFPNFSFIDAPFNLQYYKPRRPYHTEVAYMGCRTQSYRQRLRP